MERLKRMRYVRLSMFLGLGLGLGPLLGCSIFDGCGPDSLKNGSITGEWRHEAVCFP